MALLGAAAMACGSDDPISPPPPVSTLVVNPARLVLGIGMSRQLSASIFDPSGAPVGGATVAFSSSDPSRASVSPDGLASYVAAGPAEIRVSSGDLLAIIPYTGLQPGHPAGTTTTSLRLPGDGQGDAPFGVAIDGEGRIFISQTNSGRLASSL